MSNSTPRAALPPLPPPKLLGRETQFGGTKFPIYGYTAEQVEDVRRETVQACAALAETDTLISEAILALLPVKSDSGHSATADAGASTAPLPDPQLCKFYAVETWPELVAAMEHHINKLQAKLPATPSLAPQRVREG